MSVLTKLLRESYDLQEERADETAYWHLQKLRQAIKDEQIKGETLPIDSVSQQRELLLQAYKDGFQAAVDSLVGANEAVKNKTLQ